MSRASSVKPGAFGKPSAAAERILWDAMQRACDAIEEGTCYCSRVRLTCDPCERKDARESRLYHDTKGLDPKARLEALEAFTALWGPQHACGHDACSCVHCSDCGRDLVRGELRRCEGCEDTREEGRAFRVAGAPDPWDA